MRQDADQARAKEMFARMTGKEKAEHIFRYYWLHMVLAVFALVVAAVFVISYLENATTKDYLYIGLQADYYDDLCPEIEQLAQQADWPEGLNFIAFPSVQSEDGMGAVQLSMFLAADELDFIVCDEYTMHLLTADDTIDCSSAALSNTTLGATAAAQENAFVLALNGTARGEKVQQFAALMMPSAS